MSRRPPQAAAALLAGALLVGSAGADAAGDRVDLEGTWHVLAHYRDSETAHPDSWRWEDRVWVFRYEGSRLHWTDYPIVVFSDKSGRFELQGTNRASRVLHAWEPNDGQLGQIRAGLEINERGSKRKSLRGSDAEGWRSAAGRGPQAFNVITYTEIWSVSDLAALPLFERDESLGGAMSESLEGHTEWRTQAIEDGGEVLRGSYNRDGTRVGRFRLMRAGDVGLVKGSGKTQGQRLLALFASQMGEDPALAEALAGGGQVTVSEEQVRAEVSKSVEAAMKERGLDPRRFQPEIQRMVDQIVREWERGRSTEQIQRMIREGEISLGPDRPDR